MKIFEFDSPEDMKDGAVAKQVGPHGLTIESLDEGGNIIKETEEQRNARLARENGEMLAEEEEKLAEQNHGLKFAIRPIKQFSIGRIEFPMEIIDEINDHIDNVIIPTNKSFADGLVGQLKNDKKSAQLDFPLDTDVGVQLKTVFEQIGKTYLKQGYERDSDTECFQCWTNHAYAGDYNPFHDHGVQTLAGLSGFLWLKNPECIEKLDSNVAPMHNASGSVDGFTHLIWGTSTRKDVLALHSSSEEYVKPEVGVMLIFPNWLKHQVLPFFGEGERRSLAMNWNVTDTEQQLREFMSEREKIKYDEYLATKKKDNEEG